MNNKGTVVSINTSETKGVVKTPLEEGLFVKDHGLSGDAHAGKWHRQVSLLADESINKLRNRGIDDLSSGCFAENITSRGIELYSLAIGTQFRIGETIQEVTQIGKECHHGCAIKQKIGDCVMPREGIFTKVIKEGIVRTGDLIEVL